MLGLRRHTVQLKSHDPAWQRHAREVCQRISEAAGIPLPRILHVGSTAVPDLRAKPIVDVDLVLQGSDDIEEVVTSLTRLGFIDRGQKDGGIGRLLVWETAPEIRSVHVHVLEFASDAWRRDLAFRDALRADPDLRERYAALKAELAQQFVADRASYRAGKATFIRDVLSNLGLHGHASVRRLQSHEVALYRAIRTEALRTDPHAFGETLDRFNGRGEHALQAWFEDYLTSPAQDILVKPVDGKVRAMCGLGVTKEDPSVGYLWGMFVSPSIRRKGVGKELVREAVMMLAVLGAARVRARVAVPNDEAIRFYEEVGFSAGDEIGKLREGSAIPVYRIELAVSAILW